MFSSRTIYTAIFLALILGVNLGFAWPLFQGEYPAFFESEQGASIFEAKFIKENFPDLSWNNFWHLGHPFSLAFSPVLPYLLAFLSKIFGDISLGNLFRIITGIFYLIAPISFYFFVRYLSGKEIVAVISSLFYTIPISSFIFGRVGDFGNQGRFLPFQLEAASKLGEGSFIIGLALLGLVSLLFLRFLRNPSFNNLIIFVLLFAFLGLTSSRIFFASFVINIIILFSEMIIADAGRKLKWALSSFLLCLGLISFWYTPEFWKIIFIFGQGKEITLNYVHFLPVAFLGLPTILTFLFLGFERRKNLQSIFVAILWVLVFFTFLVSLFWFKAPLAPQSQLFLPLFDMGFGLLLALSLVWFLGIFSRFLGRYFIERLVRAFTLSAALTFIAVFFFISFLSIPASRIFTKPHPNIAATQEWRTAKFLKAECGAKRSFDCQVLAEGNLENWLNVWTEIFQVGGGKEQGTAHPWTQEAKKEIFSLRDIELAKLWLQALGVDYLAVDQSLHPSGERQSWERISQKLAEIEDITLYVIPQSLAQINIVKKTDFAKLEKISQPDEKNNLIAYIDTVSQRPGEEPNRIFDYQFDKNKIKIEADLKEDEILAIMISWHPGWRTNNGKAFKDPLGFIYILPGKFGKREIILSHGRTFFDGLGLAITIFSANLLLVLGAKPVRKRLAAFLKQYEKIPSGVPGQKRKEDFLGPLIGESKETAKLEREKLEKGESLPSQETAKGYFRESALEDEISAREKFQGFLTLFHRQREKVILRLVEEYGVGNKYLDAGCGAGLILRSLPAGSVGIDINPRSVEKCKRYAPQATVLEADIEKMPFPDESFSTVILAQVLEYLPDPSRTLEEVKRVLIPGGVIIGSVANRSVFWKLRRILGIRPSDEPFRKEYTEEELKALFSQFEIVRISPALQEMLLVFIARKK